MSCGCVTVSHNPPLPTCCGPVTPPTIAGFATFVQNDMGITPTMLPANSMWIFYAFCVAEQLVNRTIQCASPLLYKLAMYNLAASNLLNYAQDPANAPIYKTVDGVDYRFFVWARKEYNMLGFVSGIIQAAADETTSESMVVPESFKNWTIANLQLAKDPYGRAYLGIASDYGDAPWVLV